MIDYITALKPFEVLVGFCVVIVAIVVLLVTLAIVLDKLNVKRFSIIPPSFEFYNDGDTKISRVSGRKKTVRRVKK